jgi:hypothetical protein
LPAYIDYRNQVRGHAALDGKPSATRLQEQDWYALPSVLEKLETFARHPLGYRMIGDRGIFPLLGQDAYLNPRHTGERLFFVETLDGLEARAEDGRVYLLRDYRKYLKHGTFAKNRPPFFNFAPRLRPPTPPLTRKSSSTRI